MDIKTIPDPIHLSYACVCNAKRYLLSIIQQAYLNGTYRKYRADHPENKIFAFLISFPQRFYDIVFLPELYYLRFYLLWIIIGELHQRGEVESSLGDYAADYAAGLLFAPPGEVLSRVIFQRSFF